jgi:hypothetical protein
MSVTISQLNLESNPVGESEPITRFSELGFHYCSFLLEKTEHIIITSELPFLSFGVVSTST